MGRAPLVVLALLVLAPAAAASPIPESDTSAQEFFGAPATQNPVFGIPQTPRHPFMAPNERSNLHSDAWQTDTNRLPGPLGRDMKRVSASHNAVCGSVTFDSKGRIETVCVGVQGPSGSGGGLFLLDPNTLDELAHYELPPRQPGANTPSNLFTDFAGGGYFYLDNRDRAVVPTTTRHVFIVGQTPDTPGFKLERDLDLTTVIPQGDKIISALPDWHGLIWFATTQGLVGTVDEDSGSVQYFDTGEKIGNSFAIDETSAVYIVTDAALYRFAAEVDGSITQIWRTTYENDGTSKPGQTEIGSGTTPTITPSGFVAITDNADPINIAVFRRTDGAFVCHAPVFEKGASNTDQSLIGAGNSFIAENNYGYSGPPATEQGGTTTPGLERVDVDAAGRCKKVWHSDEIAPSVVPKLSLANGIVYTYTKPGGDSSDPWYLTALDFRTGKTLFKFKAGSGLGFNNNYAPVTIGPDGTAYVGTLGGLVAMRDSTPPPPVAFGADGRRPTARPRLKLQLRYGHRGTCSQRVVRATVQGADRALVRRVEFRLGRRHVATDRRAPFTRRFRVGAGRFGARVHARVRLVDGRRLKLHRPLQPCSRGVAG
jgi:outer membrane protein assembly factor BamB